MLDADLASIQDARDLLERAHLAQMQYARYDQAQVDRVVEALARAATDRAQELAKLAVRETGMGRVESKTAKNLLCSKTLFEHCRNLRTCGILREDAARGIIEVGDPVGIVAGIIPTTNPTSTTIFKALIALKGRNAIVFSPHPRAVECIGRTAEVMRRAVAQSGAPEDLILCMRAPTLEGTHELMKHRLTSMIVATGGPGVVRAAYSSGKPAFGVGPGNPAVFVHRSADLAHAARCIVASQAFDYGTICSSEQSLVVEHDIATPFRAELERAGAHFCDARETALLERLIVDTRGQFNTAVVGQSAQRIAELAGLDIARDRQLLIAPIDGVGRDYPLSREVLAPVLAWFETDDWKTGCERCIELISQNGMGHTLGIHCRDRDVVNAFACEKPVGRLVVNGPTTQGAVGYSTDLQPSMTLGCGTYGGNITSDNIGPQHMINIKRVAYPSARGFAQLGLELSPDNQYQSTGASGSEAAPAFPSTTRPSTVAAREAKRGAPADAMIERAMFGARTPPGREFYHRRDP